MSAQDRSRVKLRWPKWLTPDVVSPYPPLGKLPFQLDSPPPPHTPKLLLRHSRSQLSPANPHQCFCVESSLVFRLTQPAAGWAASGSEDEPCRGNIHGSLLRWYRLPSAVTAFSISSPEYNVLKLVSCPKRRKRKQTTAALHVLKVMEMPILYK